MYNFDNNGPIKDKKVRKNLLIFLFILFSHLLVLGILSTIVNVGLTENNKFNYVYDLSKILTVKSIVLSSHNSEIIDSFSSSGIPTGLSPTYKNYLKLIKNGRCIENYKPCGILDTYGNLLCIDEFFQCPINKMKVDIIAKQNDYLIQNYDTAPLNEMSNTHKFFYSNDFINGNAKVIIVKTVDEPKYITNSNFIIDTEAYKEKFGDLDDIEFLDDILNIFDNTNNNNNNNEEEDDLDKVIKVVHLVQSQDDDSELIIKGAKAFTSFLSYSYKKQVKRFEKYVKEKINHLEEEKNIDTYYNYFGDNFYDKNYIGFKSIQDLNKFMNFDYNIYKEKFPNHTSSVWAVVCLVFICMFIVCLLYIIFNYKECYRFNEAPGYVALITILSLFFYAITLGFMIYSIIAYIKLNKNQKLDELKIIEADEFICDFIDEFVSICQKNGLVICCLCITIIAFIMHISSLISFFLELPK